VLTLDCGAEFDPARDAEFFSALPQRPTVFSVELRDPAARPYLARSANLRMRLERLLGPPDPAAKRLNLRELAARVRYRIVGSAFEQALLFYDLARALHPARYRALLRLRPPALLKVSLRNAYPRCYVTRRLLNDGGFYFGPFSSRGAADAFAGEFLNFFRIRRCQIKIRRDPAFPGCLYSEMKMCLAPCFAGCSDEQYAAETSRVVRFLETGGASLASELEAERQTASAGEDFERAAAIHKKLDKVSAVLRGLPDLPRRIPDLHALALQPAASETTVACFAVRGGRIAQPFFLDFGQLAGQPRSAEEMFRDHLESQTEPSPPAPGSAGGEERSPPESAREEQEDHLSLLARWFYSKPRAGEIFFPQPTRGTAAGLAWPYRRILRGCSRVLAAGRGPQVQRR